jgi:hypothetical protein
MTVVMPVGPSCDPTFIDDTLASIEYYAEPGWRLILVDDSRRKGLCRSLGRSNATIVPAQSEGVLGGLYLNLSDGFLAALDQPFDLLLRIDTDALVIGSGFEDSAVTFFQTHPSVGCLGPHTQDYDGTPDDHSWARNQILRHLTVRWGRTPATSAVLAWIILRAWLHGYRFGELVDGGVCIYSRLAIENLHNHGLLGNPMLGRVNLTEDYLFSLALRACGMNLANFGSASDVLPIGSQWRGLAASPEDLIRAKKCLIHSTRFWNNMDEASIRADFGRRRC